MRLIEYGPTDSGHPLHLAVVSMSGEFDPVKLWAQGKLILLVNNAIHPDEPKALRKHSTQDAPQQTTSKRQCRI